MLVAIEVGHPVIYGGCSWNDDFNEYRGTFNHQSRREILEY